MKRDRLGKGLGALLGEYLGDAPSQAVQARMLPVSTITPNPFQPRREFSEQELSELAASIRENGLLQPIVVRPATGASGAPWELVAGERRWRAVTRLGWKEVPAVVRDVDDRTLLVLALVENLQRAQLSALDEADGFKRLGEEFGLSQQEIADYVGRDRSTVANSLRLLHLPQSIQHLLATGELSAGHARALLGAGNERRMIELAREAVSRHWSVRELEARVQRTRPAGKPGDSSPHRTRDANERLLEEELQRVFGAEVRIRSQGLKGRIEIPFSGAEDFERVFELLTGRPTTQIIS
jgi:ParB family chromosome partitioning protein